MLKTLLQLKYTRHQIQFGQLQQHRCAMQRDDLTTSHKIRLELCLKTEFAGMNFEVNRFSYIIIFFLSSFSIVAYGFVYLPVIKIYHHDIVHRYHIHCKLMKCLCCTTHLDCISIPEQFNMNSYFIIIIAFRFITF